MAYVGQTRSAALVRQLWELGIGECTVRGELPPRRHPWFFDNGAFGDWQAGKPFDEAQYRADVGAIRGSADRPRFLVLPDRVAGGLESLEESRRWLPELADVAPLAPSLAGLFVGGTLPWKIATGEAWVRAAHDLGLACHIGRCGNANRVRWARRIGADSIDSALPLWSEDNLGRFLRALNPKQMELLG